MKKILYIATSNMYVDTGGGIANRAYYNVLKEAFPNRIDVIHIEVSPDIKMPSNFYQVSPLTNGKRGWFLLVGRLHRYYKYVLDFLDSRKNEYSHCFINTGVLGDLVNPLQKRGIKVATIHHNYEVDFQRDNKRPTTFWGWYTGLVRRNERKSYLLSDLNLFLTISDKVRFSEEYGELTDKKSIVIGTFEAEDKKITCLSFEPLHPEELAICGSLNSVQTLKGIKDFSVHYLPLIHQYYNDYFKLTITGRSPVEYIKNLAASDNNIRLVPSPENISEVIKSCGIFICPTNVGGGIKLRIMDGLKLGMPIITHEVSARGYDCFFEKPWFTIYRDNSSFTDALYRINKLINSRENLRHEIIEDYRRLFSFPAGRKRFLHAIENFINM